MVTRFRRRASGEGSARCTVNVMQLLRLVLIVKRSLCRSTIVTVWCAACAGMDLLKLAHSRIAGSD